MALLASLGVGVLGTITLWLLAPSLVEAVRPTAGDRLTAMWTIRISALWLPPLLTGGVLAGAGRAVGRARLAAALSGAECRGVQCPMAAVS